MNILTQEAHPSEQPQRAFLILFQRNTFRKELMQATVITSLPTERSMLPPVFFPKPPGSLKISITIPERAGSVLQNTLHSIPMLLQVKITEIFHASLLLILIMSIPAQI